MRPHQIGPKIVKRLVAPAALAALVLPGLTEPIGAAPPSGALGAAQPEMETPYLITVEAPLSRRDIIAAVQRRLTDLGFDPGPIDGAMGPRTRAAIRDFQESQGLTADGKASTEVLAHLNAAITPAAADPNRPEFVATWLLGTWKVDCASDEPGVTFDQVAYDRTWSPEWKVVLDEELVRVCRDDEESGSAFCYLYARRSEQSMTYIGYQGADARIIRNISVSRCE